MRLENDLECRLEENVLRRIEDLAKEGFLEKEGTMVRSTMKGRLVLDMIAERLV